MKKNYIIIPALLISAFSFAQNAKTKPGGVRCMTDRLASKFAREKNSGTTKIDQAKQVAPSIDEIKFTQEELKSAAVTVNTWSVIGGSANIYGVLYSDTEPLHYQDNLNAVSFIHRASATYTGNPSSPNTLTGAMVVEISQNWGTSWDSTCVFSDASVRGRYPQGAIYNPSGNNSNINNAYFVGTGPVTDGTNWISSWAASKQLGSANYNATASSTPGAMQFFSSQPPYPSFGPVSYATYGFAATDDGKVKSIGVICNDINGTSNAQFGMRGAMVLKGTFNAGVFNWTGDSLCPATIVRTDGSKQLWGAPKMAWSETGQVGYVGMLGAVSTATGSNKSFQPIIYKTTNSGGSWTQVTGIDFNLPAFSAIKSHIASVNTNSALEVPFFKFDEGWDMVVDNADKVHIVSTIVGAASTHNDSIDFTFSFTAENYAWSHRPGEQAYLYDFIGDGSSAWTYILVDSLPTEGPGSQSTDPGFNDNPWDLDQGQKVTSDCRIQAGKTTDGSSIIYSWAESDTNFTTSQKKWNSIPNIKVRALNALTNSLSTTEFNATKPPTGLNINVANRAMFHYMAPECIMTSCAGNTTTIKVPLTVSNSSPYAQLSNNKHWFSAAAIDFVNLGCPVSVPKNLAYNVKSLEIFPNPASNRAIVSVEVNEAGKLKVEVYSIVGQLMKSFEQNATSGQNQFSADLSNLSPGVYVVRAQIGNTISTSKLIIE